MMITKILKFKILFLVIFFVSIIRCKKHCAYPVYSNMVSSFDGLNWSDKRDNFVNGYIVPSGLDSSYSYDTMLNQSRKILMQCKQLMKINTIRIAINAPTVLDGNYYKRWSAIINAAKLENIRVILACWERPAEKNGRVDNRFYEMWDTILTNYKDDDFVYFEPLNEPFGYSTNEWKNIASDWIYRYSSIPKNRILIGGSGYSEHIKNLACDKRFDSCLFSVHIYEWFAKINTEKQWQQLLRSRIDEQNAARTMITEFGVPMKTGIDYTNNNINDKNIVFFNGITSVIKEWNMGNIYWVGLRDNDDFSILERSNTNEITVTNNSGLQKIIDSYN